MTAAYREGDELTVYAVVRPTDTVAKHTIRPATGKVVRGDEGSRLWLAVPGWGKLYVGLPGRPRNHFANAFLTFDEAREQALYLVDCEMRNAEKRLALLRQQHEAITNLRED